MWAWLGAWVRAWVGAWMWMGLFLLREPGVVMWGVASVVVLASVLEPDV